MISVHTQLSIFGKVHLSWTPGHYTHTQFLGHNLQENVTEHPIW